LVISLDLSELEDFGRVADHLQQHALAGGAFLVPGGGSAGRSEPPMSDKGPGPKKPDPQPDHGKDDQHRPTRPIPPHTPSSAG